MLEEVNVELLSARNEFRKYYDAELRNDYVLLEEKRKVYLKEFIKRLVSCVLPVYLWFFVCEEPGIGYWAMILVGFYLFYFGVACVLCCAPFEDYRKETKSLVLEKILLFFSSSVKFGKELISWKDIEKSGLFGDYFYDKEDDEFEIIKDGVKIVVSEKQITRDIYPASRRFDCPPQREVFNGVMMLLDFDKRFKGKIVVKEKGGFKLCQVVTVNEVKAFKLCFLGFLFVWALYSMGLSIYNGGNTFEELMMQSCYLFVMIVTVCMFWNWIKKKNKIQEVLLEDVVFSKKWKVMGTDQVEARYVLTPALMERLLKVKKCFHGNKLDFAFYDNKLLITVSTNKDMFETTFLLQKAVSYHKVNEVVSQLFAVCSVANLIMSEKKS